MKDVKKIDMENEERTLQQELKENPYRRFNIAFALMSVIPFLAFLYIITVKLFTEETLVGDTGLVLLLAVLLSVCGYAMGYKIIKTVLDKVIIYAAYAKHKDHLKSQFVTFVSHDLKSPLAVIKINMTNLYKEVVGPINRDQKDIIRACQNMIERMVRLIGDMLDLYKLEAGMTKVEKLPCNMKVILEKQLKEFEVPLSGKRIRLTKEFSPKELSILADKIRITEVINNLLSNAVKFTPEDGVIKLSAYPADIFVKLEVANTGSGIPVEQLPKVFDKFEKMGVAKEGTGLGLAIAKDIVELHDGRIWVESEPGKNTTFFVLLPRHNGE